MTPRGGFAIGMILRSFSWSLQPSLPDAIRKEALTYQLLDRFRSRFVRASATGTRRPYAGQPRPSGPGGRSGGVRAGTRRPPNNTPAGWCLYAPTCVTRSRAGARGVARTFAAGHGFVHIACHTGSTTLRGKLPIRVGVLLIFCGLLNGAGQPPYTLTQFIKGIGGDSGCTRCLTKVALPVSAAQHGDCWAVATPSNRFRGSSTSY